MAGKGDRVNMERRQHKRYPLSGEAAFRTTRALEGAGEPVNISIGGVLLRSAVIPSAGTDLWVHFSLQDHPEKFITTGRVAHTEQDKLAVMFLEQPAGLGELLQSLERAH